MLLLDLGLSKDIDFIFFILLFLLGYFNKNWRDYIMTTSQMMFYFFIVGFYVVLNIL